MICFKRWIFTWAVSNFNTCSLGMRVKKNTFSNQLISSTMKKLNSTLFVLFILLSTGMAQQKLRSTKLIRAEGIEELYQIQTNASGYLTLGMKGNHALDKNLWLNQMDANMQMQRAVVAKRLQLSDPFHILELANGEFLVLAQQETKGIKQSVLFRVNSKFEVIWAKNFSLQREGLELTDMVMGSQQEVYVIGKSLLSESLAYDQESLFLIRLNQDGQILWQKAFSFGQTEIHPKQVLFHNGNLLITGHIIQPQDNNTKVYVTKWFALQYKLQDESLQSMTVPGKAYYGHAKGTIVTENGYMSLLNDANYFGQTVLLSMNDAMQITASHELQGTPMLCSGLMQHGGQFLIGSVFSNSFNDYSPGYILYQPGTHQVLAKSSPTLFRHFFVSSLLPLPDEQFMVSGIGYQPDEASDVYLLPFNAKGESACNLNSQQVVIRLAPLSSGGPLAVQEIKSPLQIKTCELQFEEVRVESNDICTAPDDYTIDPEKNKSWAEWHQNNQKAFTIEAPKDWLQVSPNPTSGKVTVTYRGMSGTDVLQLKILNAESKVIYNESIRNQDIFEIDLKGFANGIYYFNMFDGRESQVVKVIKQ